MVHVLAQDTITISPAVLAILVLGVIFQFGFNAFVAVALNRMNKQDRDVESLKQQLAITTEKLVDERLRAMSHDLRGSIGALTATVNSVTERLMESEQALDGLGQRDHSREIQILQGLAQIKEHLAQQAASKTDLKEHQREMGGRVDRIQEHLGKQDERLVRIEAAQAEKRGGGRGA